MGGAFHLRIELGSGLFLGTIDIAATSRADVSLGSWKGCKPLAADDFEMTGRAAFREAAGRAAAAGKHSGWEARGPAEAGRKRCSLSWLERRN